MQHLSVGDGDSIAYLYEIGDPERHTFVTFNALTQSLTAWDAVAAAWCAQGHSVLRFDLRGQPHSSAADGVRLDVERIAADARALIEHVQPTKPVLVGLSIGGLFAARTLLAGVPAEALVLINTLRAPGARLSWINDAVLRAMELGGGELVRDMFAPVLMSPATLEGLRGDAFPGGGYAAPAPDSPIMRLMRDCADADWDLPYEVLDLPVLVVTGTLDRLFFEADIVNALTLRMPRSQRVNIDSAGHLVPAEQPQAFADAVVDFASGL